MFINYVFNCGRDYDIIVYRLTAKPYQVVLGATLCQDLLRGDCVIGIYRVTNKVNQKSYIGQSTNIKKRLNSHKNAINRKPDDYRGQGPLYDDIRKYGIENFEFVVLSECLIECLDELEEYFIALYDSCNTGYNRTKTVYAMSDSDVVERTYTPERRKEYSEIMKQTNKKMWSNPEYREKQSKLLSDIQKERLKDPTYLKLKSDQLKQHWESKKKKVAQYTIDGKLVAVFDGLRIAERETGIKSIHKHLAEPHKRKQAGGFVWKYLNE